MADYKAGVTAKDITPPIEWIQAGRIWLWGYGNRTQPCSGVHDPISARALIIQDNDFNSIVLIGVDVCALDLAMTQSIRQRIKQSIGIAEQRVCINVSHTHGAPVVVEVPTWQAGFETADPAYLQFLEDRIVAAAQEAAENIKPANIAFSRGATDIGFDRHFPKINGENYYDPTLDVLKITEHSGKPIAVAFFVGCHPVCLNNHNEIYADYPGLARACIEKELGGMALFFQGYAGIVNPQQDLSSTGQSLAGDVIALLKNPMNKIKGSIEARLSNIQLPLLPLDKSILATAKTAGDIYERWASYMAALDSAAPGFLTTQLQAFRLGTAPHDWYLLASSHEVGSDYAESIRAILPGKRVTVMGYSNSQLSYLPSSKILSTPAYDNFPFCTDSASHINYEGGLAFAWYGHRAPVTAEVENIFINGHIALLNS